MGNIAKGKTKVGLVLDEDIIKELTTRADALHQPLGTFARWILDDWKVRGYPPINDADRAMQLVRPPDKKATRKIA